MEELELYEKYGLEVERVEVEGDQQILQTMQAERADVMNVAGGPVVASLTTDIPLLSPITTRTNVTDLLVTNGITDADGLRGKAVAVSGFGAASHAYVLMALDELGLTSDDVVITAVGGESERFAALVGGSVAAAPIGDTRRAEMEELGLHILVDLGATDQGFVRGAAGVRREFAEQNPNTVLAITAATLEAVKILVHNPDVAIAAFAAWADIPEEEARATYETLVWRPDNGRHVQDNWVNVQRQLTFVDDRLADVDVSEAYTSEFLDRLDELGVTEQIEEDAKGDYQTAR